MEFCYCPTCDVEFASQLLLQQHSESQDHLNKRELSLTRFCETCKISLTSSEALDMHEFSLLHQSNLEEYWEPMGPFVCMDCRYNFLDYDNLQLHYDSQKHLVMEEDLFLHEVVEAELPAVTTTYCDVCKFDLASAATWTTHRFSLVHQTNLGAAWTPLTEHVCNECSFYFSTEHQLKLHLNSAKHLDKTLQLQQQQQRQQRMTYCRACKQEFSTSAMATHRFSLQHQINLGDKWKPESDHVCFDCRQFFTCALHLDAHLRSSKHWERTTKPATTTTTVPVLVKPAAMADKKSMHCVECNEIVSGGAIGLHRFSLQHQINLGAEWKPITEFTCTTCPFYFINAHDLAVHLKSPKHFERLDQPRAAPLPQREITSNLVRCEPCKLDFSSQGMSSHKFSLAHQTNLGADWKPLTEHVCLTCRLYFSVAYHLQSHLATQKHMDRINTLQNERMPAVINKGTMVHCAPCNVELPEKTFSVHKFSLVHQTNLGKNWTPLTTHVCVDCNFYFSGAYQLDVHMMTQKHLDRVKLNQQTQVNQAHCNVCDLNFESQHALDLHQFSLLHQSALGSEWIPVGDYVCTACSFYFDTAYALHLHSRSPKHLENVNKFPFVQTECRCGLCDVSFANRTLRHQHSLENSHNVRKAELVAEANTAFDTLDSMNAMLLGLNLPPADNKDVAPLLLREVHINVFDLILKKYEYRFLNAVELRVHAEQNDLYFPLDKAHADGLKVFLRSLPASATRI